MRGDTSVRRLIARRWVRRTLIATATAVVVLVGLATVGTSGGVILRDDDGCPRSVGSLGSVSWVDVLHVRGETYERVDLVAPHTSSVDRSQLGEQLDTIRCSTADAVQRPDYRLRDGEATFLEPGAPVHALAGTDPAFRVVAVDDGTPAVYENRSRPATTGAELLPFAPEDVRGVVFLSEEDGRTVLGEIRDPDAVRGFVEALRAAPIADPPDLGEEPRVFIALAFRNQPPFTLVAYPGHAVTTDGLTLTDAVLEQLPAPADRA